MKVRLTIVTALVALLLPVAAQSSVSSQVHYMHQVTGLAVPWVDTGWIMHNRMGEYQYLLAQYRVFKKVFNHPPHSYAWWCIHRGEGSWTDPNSPFWGGLQMDLGFQRSYGGWLLATKGTADHWTPLEQMWTAEKALRAGRGFYPWPNTARVCGLI